MPENACPRRWGSFERPIPLDLPAEGAAVPEPEPIDSAAERLERWKARQAQREGWSRNRREERRWEERWKAAGERLRADQVTVPAVPPAPPSAVVAPTLAQTPAPRAATPPPRPLVAREITPPVTVAPTVVAPAAMSHAGRAVLAPADWGKTPIPKRAEMKAAPAVLRPQPVEAIAPAVPPPSAWSGAPAALPSEPLARFREVQPPVEPRSDQPWPEPLGSSWKAGFNLPSVPSDGRLKPALWDHAEPLPARFTQVQAVPECESPPPPVDDPPASSVVVSSDWPDEEPYIADTNLGQTEPWVEAGLLTSTLATPVVWPEPEPARDEAPAARRPSIRPSGRRARRTTARSRPLAEPAALPPPAPATGVPEPDRGPRLPTAREILDAQRRATPARPAPLRRVVSEPLPTMGQEPAYWKVPLWLGWCPALAIALVVGGAGLALSWCWAIETEHAGVIADRLARGGTKAGALPEWVTPPDPRWWKSTPGQLTLWALERDRMANDRDREGGDAAVEEVRELLKAATQAAPLQAAARFALARQGSEGDTRSSLALSRDVVALAWMGHQRLAAGKQEAALLAFREALAMAATADVARLAAPGFNDDTQIRRYALPAEDLIGPIVQELAGHGDWTYREWSAALPPLAVARLAAVRALRGRSSPDAPAALDALLAQADALLPSAGGPAAAIHWAAMGEALALKGRWDEAEARYRQAIDLMSDASIRRSWWMNLAEIALRLNDESNRQKALEAAKGNDPNDEITRRAVELLRFHGVRNQRIEPRPSQDVTTNGLP